MATTTRRQLLRWVGWFAAANGGLLALAGLRYVVGYSPGADTLGVVYALLAWIGHFALLAGLPAGLVLLPLALAAGRRVPVVAAGIVLMAALLTLLVVDANVFAEQRNHLTPLTAMLFETRTWVFVGVIATFALAFETLLAGYVWRWVEERPARGGRALAILLCLAWLGSQAIHIWADAVGHTPVTQLTRYLPAYFPIHAKRTLARLGLVDPARVEEARALRRTAAAGEGQLDYPLAPLSCSPPTPLPNILVVLIDALRPDAVHPGITPRLAGFAAEGQWFADHWSGGNSSKAGIFSMFYGLPPTYMEAFYGVQRSPVLLDEVRRNGYELGLFAAPGFSAPTDIGRTVFAGVPGLPGERGDLDAVARNRAVTDDWFAWLDRRDGGRPFFGFLYYDPPMGEMPADAAGPLALDERYADVPALREAWRRYRLAARMADGELGRVLDRLSADGLAAQTIVVVASDHGYEFDDSGLGYVGHAGNYTGAQLRATLAMRWPGRDAASFGHRTSHHDLPVTLLEEVFGCANDAADYSVGRNLFAGEDWNWIVAGSYSSHAIVEPGRVIVTHPGGFVEVLGPDYRPAPGLEIDARIVESALRDMRRFYR